MLAVVFLLFCLLISATAFAHPHVWVELRVRPLLNEQGQLTGLQQAWRFDPFYSLILIEELQRGGPSSELEKRYDELASEVVANLQRFDFFSRLHSEGRRLPVGQVQHYNLMRIGQRVEFSFVLPLQHPVSLNEARVSYQVYDPSYFIEILHIPEQGVDTQSLDAACRVRLEAPNPSSEQIEKAMALDVDDISDDPQLGQYFAERVVLDCRP
ncbi:DUF1007 family protein [Marinospirillum alkaliphilum]|uniref:DUF1007 family protein n=1 Tax=Marinospirillum alkaliphilum TaxID=148454 RepID=UPI0015A70A51|nr:DUF1007 family protein [Marinospirillum alkaliphilum]